MGRVLQSLGMEGSFSVSCWMGVGFGCVLVLLLGVMMHGLVCLGDSVLGSVSCLCGSFSGSVYCLGGMFSG